jgi:hypothetical protein
LYLREIRLTCLEENTFSSLKLLIQLDISNNRLSTIGRTIFNNLDSLEYLNISSNLIKYIYMDQFSSLINLFDLDMSDNLIEHFYPSTFCNLTRLKNLYFHMNRLKVIDKLDGLNSIKNVYLDSSLLLENFTNVVNLKDSIHIKLYKKSRDISYFKSVNVISYSTYTLNNSINEYCSVYMFLIKYSVSLNLKTDEDFDLFFDNCLLFSTQTMFVESIFTSTRIT